MFSKIIQFVDGIVYLGSGEGNVSAFNAAGGAILWNYTIGDGTLSTPTVADGAVYIGSTDDNIYALNARLDALVLM